MYCCCCRDEVLEASDEAVNTSSEGVEEGGGDCEEVTGDGESDEPHYERAPVSQGGSVLISEGESRRACPVSVVIPSLPLSISLALSNICAPPTQPLWQPQWGNMPLDLSYHISM